MVDVEGDAGIGLIVPVHWRGSADELLSAITADFDVNAVRVMLSSHTYGLNHGRVQRNHLVTPDVIAGLEALRDSKSDDTTLVAEVIEGIITGIEIVEVGSISDARTRVEKTGVSNDVKHLFRQIGISAIAVTFGQRVYNRSMMTLGPGCESSGDGRSGLDLESIFIRCGTLVADHIAGTIVSEIDIAVVRG